MHEVAFSVNGEQFATGGKSICLWNAADGKPLGSLQTQEYSLTRGDLSCIGYDKFNTFTRRGKVLAWQPEKDKVYVLHNGTGTMYARVNAARDRMVVADTGAGPVAPSHVQNTDIVPASTVLLSLVGQMGQIAVLSENEVLSGIRFSDDGRTLVAAQETWIKTWDARTGELLSSDRGAPMDDRYLAQNDELIGTALYAPGSVVEAIRGQAATHWRLGGARALNTLVTLFGPTGEIALDEDTRAAMADYFANRSESKLQGGNWPNDSEPETSEVSQLGGPLVATAARDTVQVTDGSTGEQVAALSADALSGLPYRHPTALFSADGEWLIVLT